MTTKEVLVSFGFYSVFGWVIDTATRSLQTGHLTQGNWLNVPFSPMYGLAALGIILLYHYIRDWKLWQEFILFAVLAASYEYVGGRFSEWTLQRRLWDYDRYPFDIGGYTDPLHAIGWGVLAMLLVYYIHPWFFGLLRHHEVAAARRLRS